MVGLLFVLGNLLVAAMAAPQHNPHLHTLPGFSVWQQHIQAVRQAEARLGERAAGEQAGQGATSSLPATDVIPDTKEEELKSVIKNIVKNNLESLHNDVEEPVEKSQVELLLERTALRDDKYQAGNSFLDQLSEIVNNGENSDKEVTELDSLNNILLDSFFDFGGETEETRSAFVGGSIFDRAEKKTVPSDRFDSDRILFGLERPQDEPPPTSSDKFLNSLIGLLVEKTNIENDFSDYLDDQVVEHNGGRAVIQLREEDYPDFFEDNYPDIFDAAADTAENFDEILNAISADSTLLLAREGPVGEVVREKTFIEEEQEATQEDVEETANQLAGLLSDLEADRLEEARLKETVLATIRQRLRGDVDYRALSRDRDFIDSVLYRFAIMKLPLRPEDIVVSEEAEVRRVVRASLSLLAKETGALLRGETARGGGLDVGDLSTARNQLQGLLNILQA